MKDIKETADDRRNFFRIDDEAVLTYKTVSWKDALAAQKSDASLLVDKFAAKAHLDRLSRELQPLYKVIKASNSNIAESLLTLDKKISLLSEYLIEEDDEADIAPREVNIGGGGLLFVSDKPVATGAILELKMKCLSTLSNSLSIILMLPCSFLKMKPWMMKQSWRFLLMKLWSTIFVFLELRLF